MRVVLFSQTPGGRSKTPRLKNEAKTAFPVLVSCLLVLLIPTLSRANTAPESWLREQLGLTAQPGNPEAVRALRMLDDESLRPVFASAAGSNDPRVRVEAQLGLASLRRPPRVPLTVIAEVDDARRLERRMLIAAALDAGWLDLRDVRSMLAWDTLEPGVKLLLCLELASRSEPPGSTDALRHIAASPDPRHAALAALLLHHAGVSDGSAQLHRMLTEPDTPPEVLALLLQTIARHHLADAGGFALSVAEAATTDGLRDLGLRTALGVGTPGVGRVWMRRYEEAQANQDIVAQTRLALLAMRGFPGTPAESFERLAESDDPFIAAVGRACLLSQSGSEGAADALEHLLAFDHPVASAWALRSSSETHWPELSAAVYRAVALNYTPGRVETRERRLNEVVEATEAWVALDTRAADLITQRWATTFDAAWREAVLLGLVRQGGSRAAALASRLDADHAEVAAALRAIVLARQPDASLDGDTLEALRRAAHGETGLDDGLRTQAAWLWLKHTGLGERVP